MLSFGWISKIETWVTLSSFNRIYKAMNNLWSLLFTSNALNFLRYRLHFWKRFKLVYTFLPRRWWFIPTSTSFYLKLEAIDKIHALLKGIYRMRIFFLCLILISFGIILRHTAFFLWFNAMRIWCIMLVPHHRRHCVLSASQISILKHKTRFVAIVIARRFFYYYNTHFRLGDKIIRLSFKFRAFDGTLWIGIYSTSFLRLFLNNMHNTINVFRFVFDVFFELFNFMVMKKSLTLYISHKNWVLL